MSEEHRKEPRFPVTATVPLWVGESAVECPASDISSHGIFLEMDEPLAADTFVKIGPANARYPARVVFVLAPEHANAMGRKPGVGLQITEPIDPDAFLLACAEDVAAARAASARLIVAASKSAPAAIDLPQPIMFDPTPVIVAASSSPRAPAPAPAPAPSLASPPRTPAASVVAPPSPPAAYVPLPGQAPPGGGFQAPPKSNVTNRPIGARKIVDVGVPGAGVGGAAGGVRGGARDLTRESSKISVVQLEVVTLDDNRTTHQNLVRALVVDDYAPLVARHGLEALVLILRKAPVLAVVPESARGLPGHIIIDEVRKRRELDGTALVLLDPDGSAPDVSGHAGVARWRDIPDDLVRVRGAIDRLLSETMAAPGTTTSRPAVTDARSLAEAMAALANNLEDRGLLDDASAALRYAGELAPTVTTHALRLARLLLSRGEDKGVTGTPRTDEAASLVERSIRLEPLSVEALVLRALIVDTRGNKEMARAALKRAQMLAPQHAEVLALLARLDAGQPLDDRASSSSSSSSSSPNASQSGSAPSGALGRLRKLFG